MVKKINEKTSGISLAGFQPRSASPAPKPAAASANPVERPAPREPSKSFTGAGIFMSAITGKDELARELAEVQAKLAAASLDAQRFEGAEVVRSLDPKTIRPSHWANRNEASFQSAEYAGLKLEIESSGGNVQPIKVRPLAGNLGQFEVVFGHRRHRACLELGLPVLALVEALSDVELFAQMDRENRQRADLRPFEQGLMYARAIDEGLFPSMRKMAEALGVDVGNASKAIALARLPADVLAAFGSPLDLQQAWATPLSNALQKNPDLVLSRARALSAAPTRSAAPRVFKALVDEGVVSNNTPSPQPVLLKGKHGQSCEIHLDAAKRSVVINLRNFDPQRLAKLEKAMRDLLA